MKGFLGSIDLAYMWDQVTALVRNPYSNLNASLLLLAAVVLSVLLVAALVMVVVTGRHSRSRRSHDREELLYYLSILAAGEEGEEGQDRPVEAYEPPSLWERVRDYPWLSRLAWLGLALLLLGVALGASTSAPSVCTTCHIETAHSAAVAGGAADPHKSVDCVACHEPSGWLGSVTIEVPGRLLHYANGLGARPGPSGYGSVVTPACYRCHRAVATATTLDAQRGIKMAHKQPLEAGAPCLGCHTNATGVVSTLTSGMAPCLRCHDGKKQPTRCTLCHTKDVSLATRSHASPSDMSGRRLIETPDCGACHDMVRQCDPCHGGVRMPHSTAFKWWGHAREGVKDVWDNGGRACATCHTAERRPCTKCHAFFPGHPVVPFRTIHAQVKNSDPCDPCHNRRAYMAGRDFCGLCHTKPYITQ